MTKRTHKCRFCKERFDRMYLRILHEFDNHRAKADAIALTLLEKDHAKS